MSRARAGPASSRGRKPCEHDRAIPGKAGDGFAAHLIDLDVPVESVRGRYGGYRLAPGYRMPPLMLSDDEALTVLLGLVAGRRTGLATGTASETATAKIRPGTARAARP